MGVMRCRAILEHLIILSGLILLIWGALVTFEFYTNPTEAIGFDFGDTQENELKDIAKRCSLSEACPSDSYAFHLWSGAANIVGPKICFEGKIPLLSDFVKAQESVVPKRAILMEDEFELLWDPKRVCLGIMSHVLNNVGPGINIVVIDSQRGVVEKFGFLDMINGNENSILEYLKTIKPGFIVLLASYMDVTPKMTEEMMNLFEAMGSSQIKSLKSKDGWVFAGEIWMKERSLFEKVSINDKTTNPYDEWPGVVEIGGCYPKELFEEIKSESPEEKANV